MTVRKKWAKHSESSTKRLEWMNGICAVIFFFLATVSWDAVITGKHAGGRASAVPFALIATIVTVQSGWSLLRLRNYSPPESLLAALYTCVAFAQWRETIVSGSAGDRIVNIPIALLWTGMAAIYIWSALRQRSKRKTISLNPPNAAPSS